MSDKINIGDSSSRPSPEELAALQLQNAQVQKDESKSTYIISSELQFMIDSLKNMASQLEHRIDEAKKKISEEASMTVGSTPSVSTDKGTAASLINTTAYPINAAGFAKALITSPSQTGSKAQLLLLSTNIDNSVQQLTRALEPLLKTLNSNVNTESLESALQKHLLDTRDAVNQIETALKIAPEPPKSLRNLQNNLTQAAQKLLKEIAPIPEDTASLMAFSQKLNTQVQSPTSALNQLHLQHQKTVNEVGGSLGMVLPSSNLSSPRQPRGLAAPLQAAAAITGGGLPQAPENHDFGDIPQGFTTLPPVKSSHNPWSEVWKWIFGSQGMMNSIGIEMSSLNHILSNQNDAMGGFSGLLTIFEDLADFGIKSHINASVTPGNKQGWSEMVKIAQGMQKFMTKTGSQGMEGVVKRARNDFSKLSAAINKLEKQSSGPLHKFAESMEAGFFSMYNRMAIIGGVFNTPFSHQKTFQYHQWHHTPGGWARVSAIHHPFKSEKAWLASLNADGNAFNRGAANFGRGAKDGGSNIQSMQTQTQSKVKTAMMYYQQLLQTGPSLIQILGQLAAAVANNMKGG